MEFVSPSQLENWTNHLSQTVHFISLGGFATVKIQFCWMIILFFDFFSMIYKD